MKEFLKKLIFVAILLNSTCFLSGQKTTYRLQAEAVSLPVLIDLLEKSYDVRFSYPSDLLENEVFYLKTNTPNLSNILNEISAVYPIEYQILNNKSILLREQFSKSTEQIIDSKKVTFSILDSETNRPLEFAALGIKGTNLGDYSNQDGEITLEITNDFSAHKLEIHLLGYQSLEVDWNSRASQNISIEPQSFSIEEVMVQDRMNVLKGGEIDHSVIIKTNHMSSFTSGIAGQDVMRQAQLLPGVAAFDDISSGLKIRGADEASSLIVFDDIPIYNASHYYGLFSAINPSYTTKSTLYKNNLPVQYDGKTAGMLQIDGPSQIATNKSNGSFDINLLTISGAINTSLSKNLSLSIGARSTYQNISDTDLFSLFNSPEEEEVMIENFSLSSRDVLLSTVPDFKFFDVASKLRLSLKNGFLELNYFQSEDDLDDSFLNEFRTRRENLVVTNTERYSNTERWMNRGLSVKLETQLKQNIHLSSVAYVSSYENESGLDIELSRSVVSREFLALDYNNIRENNVRDYGFKTIVSGTSNKLEWSAGIDIVEHNVAINVSEQDDSLVKIERSSLEKSVFASTNLNIGTKLDIELGTRVTSYNGNLYSAPRLNLFYKHSEKFRLKASLGRHNQFVRQLSFENSFGRSLDFWVLSDNDRFEVSSADQVMLGATYKVGRFSFDIESYLRKRYDLLEQALFDPRFNETSIFPLSRNEGNEYRLFTGDGQTIGFDFTTSVTYPKYSGWLTYTLSKSTIQYDQILRGISFPSQDDRRHQVKWINEYKMGRFTIGANLIYASGRPYTDLNKVTSLRRDELTPEGRLSRLPDYIRTDLGVTYDLNFGPTDMKIGVSAYNLLNRQNVNYIQYLFSIPTNSANNPNSTLRTLLGTESALLNRTVNVSLKVNF